MPVLRDRPYAGFNFIVEFGGIEPVRFQQVSGLTVSTDVIEYRDGTDRTNAIRRFPGLYRVDEISLKHGAMGSVALFQWIDESMNGKHEPRHVNIRLMTEDLGDTVMRWHLLNCWPIRYVCGPFDGMKSTILVEELVLCAESMQLD